MKKTLLFLMLALVWSFASCSSDGDDPNNGETKPDKPVVEQKDTIKIASITYDKLLSELRVTWQSVPESYAGVQVSFTTINGFDKTVRMMVDNEFDKQCPKFKKFFTVYTEQPMNVRFKPIFKREVNGREKEYFGGEQSTQQLSVNTNWLAWQQNFKDLITPKFIYLPISESFDQRDEIIKGYNAMAGNTDAEKDQFFSDLLKKVLSAAYLDTDPETGCTKQPVRTLKCDVRDMGDGSGIYAYVINYSDADGGPLYALSYNVLRDQAKAGNIDVVGWEGVTKHEFTHLIQKINWNRSWADGMGMQEGYADAIRIATQGFTKADRLNQIWNNHSTTYYDPDRMDGNNHVPYVWQFKYRDSGFFMSWLRTYDGDFLRKLTLSTQMIDKWGLDEAVKFILGKKANGKYYEISDLWNEYISDGMRERG